MKLINKFFIQIYFNLFYLGFKIIWNMAESGAGSMICRSRFFSMYKKYFRFYISTNMYIFNHLTIDILGRLWILLSPTSVSNISYTGEPGLWIWSIEFLIKENKNEMDVIVVLSKPQIMLLKHAKITFIVMPGRSHFCWPRMRTYIGF